MISVARSRSYEKILNLSRKRMNSRSTGRPLIQDNQPGNILRELTEVPSVHFHTPHPQRCRTHICPEVELGNKASIFNPSQGSLTGLLCSEYSRTRNNQRSHRSRYVVRRFLESVRTLSFNNISFLLKE